MSQDTNLNLVYIYITPLYYPPPQHNATQPLNQHTCDFCAWIFGLGSCLLNVWSAWMMDYDAYHYALDFQSAHACYVPL